MNKSLIADLIYEARLKPINKIEFIFLMALLTSAMPLAMDSMLPAFPNIAKDLHLHSSSQVQLIVAILFLGFGCGQMIFGPISDIFGRKAPTYWGLAIFIFGALLSAFAPNFTVFLVGRFLQGFGAAAPRVISLALIRDQYSGNAMAQVTSFVMTIFIFVPAIAPSLGKFLLLFAGWRFIFIALFLAGLLSWSWFALRQHETLPKNMRRNFTLKEGLFSTRETFRSPTTVICMFVSGLIFGIFVGYLGAIQDIFGGQFHDAENFPLYFAAMSLSIGVSSFFNAKLVLAWGMRKLVFSALTAITLLAIIFAYYLTYIDSSIPPLWLFMIYMMSTFFAIGFLFGNLNAMAMEPVGHVAGMGSAYIGFVQSIVAVALGVVLGPLFNEHIVFLTYGFAGVGLVSIVFLAIEQILVAKHK